MADWAAQRRAMMAAAHKLQAAGFAVRETNVSGLFDVDGIGSDLTIGQLLDVAARAEEFQRERPH